MSMAIRTLALCARENIRPVTMAVFTALAIVPTFEMKAEDAVTNEKEVGDMAKVTGIGGVFFLSRGSGKDLSAWYERHLGLQLEEWGGAVLNWEEDKAEDKGLTVWNVADSDSDWFGPSNSSFMINYRVDNMEALIRQLNEADIEILKGPEYHENGVFAWIMDPEGNKIELWEPKVWDENNKQ